MQSQSITSGRINRKSKTPTERFWEKVQKTDGCWLWTAGKIKAGYGILAVRENCKTIYARAHCFSWELHFGPVNGKHVCHTCDNPACVRPDHLFLGTHAENMADMVRKGRNQHGETHSNAKLTAAQVAEIRERRKEGAPQEDLARQFGISRGHVSGIVNGHAWKDV